MKFQEFELYKRWIYALTVCFEISWLYEKYGLKFKNFNYEKCMLWNSNFTMIVVWNKKHALKFQDYWLQHTYLQIIFNNEFIFEMLKVEVDVEKQECIQKESEVLHWIAGIWTDYTISMQMISFYINDRSNRK